VTPLAARLRLVGTLLVAAAALVAISAASGGQPLLWAVQGPAGDTLRLELRVPSLAAVFRPAQAPAALDSMMAQALAAAEADTAEAPPVRPTRRVLAPRANYGDSASLDAKIRLVNPQRDDGTQALDAFFTALYALDSDTALSRTVRVAHYGDSQIEGDRVTQHLRRQFHRRFGGGGVGYVPLLEPATHHAMARSATPNWRRYTMFQYRRKDNPYYYLSGQVFRFGAGRGPALLPDSASDDSGRKRAIAPAVGQLEADHGAMAGVFEFVPSKALRFDRLQLVWGRGAAPYNVRYSIGDSLMATHRLAPDSSLVLTELGPVPPQLLGRWRAFRLQFDGPSPDVYGLLLDAGTHGVQVDNYGLRGHAGHGLKRIDGPWLGQMVERLDTRLIIIQFGGNVVRYDTRDFRFYEKHVYEILERFRTYAPGASLLVIGVGDMAEKHDDAFESYASVPLIRDAQRRAAERAGAAFWDLYQAMGGAGSIVTWVNANPPLAAADYAHFSPAGQRLVGNLLFRALMNEYADYVARVQGPAADPQPRPKPDSRP